MKDLLIWGKERPKPGTYFVAYGRYDEEPSLCEMTESGPEHCQFNWRIDDPIYGGGGTLESELVFADETRWHYLATKTPDWQAIVGKMIEDGVKV